MSDRSIAEIIGCVRCGRCKKHWNHDDEWGSERPINESPTVDDLIAWLNQNLFHLWFEVYGDPAALPEAWDVYANYTHVVSYGDEQDRHFNACAPTLLAALEAVVRAVDSQSSLTITAPAELEVEAHRDLSRGATSPSNTPSL